MRLLTTTILLLVLLPVWASTSAWRGLILAVKPVTIKDGGTAVEVTVRLEWSSWPKEDQTITFIVPDSSPLLTLDGVASTPADACQVGHAIQVNAKGPVVQCFSDPKYLPYATETVDPAEAVYHLRLRSALPLSGTVTKKTKKGVGAVPFTECSDIMLHLAVRNGKVITAAANAPGRRGGTIGWHFSGMQVDPGTLAVADGRLTGDCTLQVRPGTLIALAEDTEAVDVALSLDVSIDGKRLRGGFSRNGQAITIRGRKGKPGPPAAEGRIEAHRVPPADYRAWVRLNAGYTTTTWLFFRHQDGKGLGDYLARYKPDPRNGSEVTPTELTLDADGTFAARIAYTADGGAEEAVLTGQLIGDQLFGTYVMSREDSEIRRGYFQGKMMQVDAPITVNPKRRGRIPEAIR